MTKEPKTQAAQEDVSVFRNARVASAIIDALDEALKAQEMAAAEHLLEALRSLSAETQIAED